MDPRKEVHITLGGMFPDYLRLVATFPRFEGGRRCAGLLEKILEVFEKEFHDSRAATQDVGVHELERRTLETIVSTAPSLLDPYSRVRFYREIGRWIGYGLTDEERGELYGRCFSAVEKEIATQESQVWKERKRDGLPIAGDAEFLMGDWCPVCRIYIPCIWRWIEVGNKTIFETTSFFDHYLQLHAPQDEKTNVLSERGKLLADILREHWGGLTTEDKYLLLLLLDYTPPGRKISRIDKGGTREEIESLQKLGIPHHRCRDGTHVFGFPETIVLYELLTEGRSEDDLTPPTIEKVGRLFGIPMCCRKHYSGHRGEVWPLPISPENASILPYIPCPSCKETVDLMSIFKKLWRIAEVLE